MREITAYMERNYCKNITLGDMAKHLCLSQNYISKYIKQNCKINFTEMVASIRLKHAMDDLIYTNYTVLKIAMDNGFPSVAAYNKCFRYKYGASPSEFLRNIRMKKRSDEKRKNSDQTYIEKELREYLQNNLHQEIEEPRDSFKNITFDMSNNYPGEGYAISYVGADEFIELCKVK